MIAMFVAAIVGSGAGVLSGGRISNIARVPLRRWWLVLAALAAQAVVGAVATAARPVVIVAALAALLAWCAANSSHRRLAGGIVLMASGILANLLVITLNAGMPVSPRALVAAGRSAHLDVTRGFLDKHVVMVARTHLAFLGDRLPFAPFRTVLSAGDLVMLAGVLVVMFAATDPAVGRAARSRLTPGEQLPTAI